MLVIFRSWLCQRHPAKKPPQNALSANFIMTLCMTFSGQWGVPKRTGASGQCTKAGNFNYFIKIDCFFFEYIIPFVFCVFGRTLFMPALCILVNDNPEGQLMALMYNSAKSACPCRMCTWVVTMFLFLLIICLKKNVFFSETLLAGAKACILMILMRGYRAASELQQRQMHCWTLWCGLNVENLRQPKNCQVSCKS